MTITSHATIGAVIAVAIDKPIIALPLAFLSHFAADAVPHFGFPGHEDIGIALKKHRKASIAIIVADIIGVIILAGILIHFGASTYVYLAALLADSADAEWLLAHFLYGRHNRAPKRSLIGEFHELIQWYERPWCYVVELVVIVSGFSLLVHLLS